MTSDDEAFLAAICETPNDDVPRLVYADYLEEHDQPERAHFIRLQCELAQLNDQHPDWDRLVREEKQLRDRFEVAWSIPKLRGVQHFNRGFIEVIQTSAEWLLDCPASAFRYVPLRELRLVTMDRFVDQVSRLELLDRVEILTLNNNSLGSRGRLEQLLQRRPLTRIQRLELRNCLLWPDSISVLANSSQASRLHTLDLSGNPVGNVGMDYLAQSQMRRLHSLIIRGDELDQRECLNEQSAETLADVSCHLKELRYLDWGDQYINDRGLQMLAASKNFLHLEQLRVPFNEIGTANDSALIALFRSEHLMRLQELDFSGNGLGEEGAAALLRWPGLKRGALVELRECEVTPEAAELLSKSEYRTQLKS
jgi:uncharacterized protein (TIGR02996 family)